MAAKDKDTIYVDIDDEITGIIDKLKVSEGKVVALVLPKRAAVFQSIVNMKLLKRAADSSKKNLVLITAEAGLLPLAGVAGVHVAKTLTSKPEIPSAPQFNDDAEEIDEDGILPADSVVDGNKTVGQLAGASAPPPPADGGVETLVLDDDLPADAASAVKPGPKAKTFEPPKAKKNKKLSIPNFNRFRLWLIIGGLVIVLLIVGIIFATIALPKATITIKTDATNVDANLSLNLSTTATSLDAQNSILPAKAATQQKTYTESAPTTGQKNNGNKASGSMTITNCGPASVTIPAGTGFSSNGQTFISQSDANVPTSNFKFGGACKDDGTATVNVIAQSSGAAYNLPANVTYSIANGSTYTTAQGGAMSGGTDSIVQTVNQNDINTAKSKIPAADSSVKSALDTQLKGENYYPIDATYNAGTPNVTTSANVGDVANTVTVTETVTYSTLGVKQSDLTTLITNNVNTQIDTSKQSVTDTGLGQAVFNVNTISATSAQLTMSTKAVAGPVLNVAQIKQQAAGQKTGAIKSQFGNNPDVTNVTVKLSPFWVSSAPKKTSRITITIAKPTTTAKASSSGAGNP
jgi:hypothetical protein